MTTVPAYSMIRRMVIFRDKHPLIGPIFWALSLQYYLTQYVVSRGWSTTFSLLHNTISDLGNTHCGQYGVRFVCSPGHDAMNASFIVLGLTMVFGSFFITSEFRRSRTCRLGFWCMALAGLGTLLVGLFPENTVSQFHILGAGLAFVFGNIALVLFGSRLQLPTIFKRYTLLSGIIALIALVLFQQKIYLGLDIGGMERIVAYPQSIWLTTFGLYMSRNHYVKRVGHRKAFS